MCVSPGAGIPIFYSACEFDIININSITLKNSAEAATRRPRQAAAGSPASARPASRTTGSRLAQGEPTNARLPRRTSWQTRTEPTPTSLRCSQAAADPLPQQTTGRVCGSHTAVHTLPHAHGPSERRERVVNGVSESESEVMSHV